MNKPFQRYTTPTIHIIEFKVESGHAASPSGQEEDEITWIEDDTSEQNPLSRESYSPGANWDNY